MRFSEIFSRLFRQGRPRSGHVYVMVNRSFPGLVKIGKTRRDPVIRARELSGTGLPYPYQVARSVFVSDCGSLERTVHRALRRCRLRRRREFFRIDRGEACAMLEAEAARFGSRVRTARRLNVLIFAAAGAGLFWLVTEQGFDWRYAAGVTAATFLLVTLRSR